MKSLGTITMYFPFVDSGTREILESMMENTYNYADFAKQLADYVCDVEVPPHLPFLAMRHAQNLCDIDSMDKISRKYSENSMVKAFYHFCYTCIHGVPKMNEASEAAQKALDIGLEDWLQLEMLFLRRMAGWNQRAEGPDLERDLKKIEDIISKNENASCYAPRFNYHQAIRVRNEGRMVEALAVMVNSMEQAEAIDDKAFAAQIMRTLSLDVRNSDSTKAVELLNRSLKIHEDLGKETSSIIASLGGVHEIRGEYTAALEKYLDALQISEKTGRPLGNHPENVAQMHVFVGEAEEALEWAKLAVDTSSHSGHRRSEVLLIMARAQIELGLLEEASDNLEVALELARKSGYEHYLASCFLAQGLLERSQGDLHSAELSFTRALETFIRLKGQKGINDCMLRLAETETAMFTLNQENRSIDSSGEWLTSLVDMAHERDYPGILALSLLIKAEFRLKQRRREDAEMLVDEARLISKQPGSRFLETKIAELLRKDQMMDA